MDEDKDNHIVVVKPAALLSICGGSDSVGKLSTILATLSLISLAALSKFMLVSNSTFIVQNTKFRTINVVSARVGYNEWVNAIERLRDSCHSQYC